MSHDQAEHVDALVADLLEACRDGRRADCEAILREHPEHASVLSAFVDDYDKVAQKFAPLRELSGGTPCSAAEVATIGQGDTAVPPPPNAGGSFGDYDLLSEVARGGMGVVYKARQKSLNRVVALKMVLGGRGDSSTDRERFLVEARAVARLNHPHIVPIYEVGEWDGQPYFTMEFFSGGSLRDQFDKLRGDQRASARMMVTVARAVEHAHRRGILHRDIKPNNVLLDEHGEPHVTDFGLAKRLDEESDLTQDGAIVGTPSYMAPEQANGDADLTTAVDVYGLGALMYELLSGRPPFKGNTPLETIMAVVSQQPQRLRRRDSKIDADLETICQKCLEKEPSARYASADALADDLERWLRHEPIAARPTPPLRKAAKWIRRHPAISAMFVLVVVGAIAVAWQWRQAVAANEQADRELNRNRLALAARECEADDTIGARQLLLEMPPERRGWEWKYLWRLSYITPYSSLPRFDEPVVAMQLSLDGDRLATLQRDGVVQFWNMRTMQPLKQFSAWTSDFYTGPDRYQFSPDLCWLAFHRQLSVGVTIVDLESEEVKRELSAKCHEVVFSPDGSLVYGIINTTGKKNGEQDDTRIRAWNVESGEEVFSIAGDGASYKRQSLFVSHDGKRLYDLQFAKVYDALTGDLLDEREIPSCEFLAISFLAISPNETTLAQMNGNAVSETRLHLERIDGSASKVIHFDSAAHLVAFSPDGREVACITNHLNIDVEDIELQKRLPFVGPMLNLAGKGQFWRWSIAVFDVRTGDRLRTLRGFPSVPRTVQFTPDGTQLIVCGGEDRPTPATKQDIHGDVVIWDLTGTASSRRIQAHDQAVGMVSVNSKGTLAATGSIDGTARVWDLATGQLLRTIDRFEPSSSHQKYVNVAFAPASDLLAVTGRGELSLVDARTGAERWTTKIDSWFLGWPAWRPDGSQIVVNTHRDVQVLDVASGKIVSTLPNKQIVVYSPDGKLVARPSQSDSYGALAIYDAKTGRRIFQHETEDRPAAFTTGWGLVHAAFSPDSRKVAAVGNNGPGLVFDARSGKKLFELHGHPVTVWNVTFSPDGGRIATSSYDGTIRIWDAESGEELRTLRGHTAPVQGVAFTPDGSRLVSGSRDGELRIWEAGNMSIGISIE